MRFIVPFMPPLYIAPIFSRSTSISLMFSTSTSACMRRRSVREYSTSPVNDSVGAEVYPAPADTVTLVTAVPVRVTPVTVPGVVAPPPVRMPVGATV